MRSLGKVSSCGASPSTGGWRSVDCVRVAVHEGETCWSRCWMLPGTLTAEGKERAYALMHTEILYGYMHMHSRQENTHAIVPTYTHTHRHRQCCATVSTGCMLHYPANHSFGNAWDRNSCWVLCQSLWLNTVQLSSVSVIWAMMMNQSSGNTHLKLASHLGSSRSVVSQLQQCASAHCTFSHSSNLWGTILRPRASWASGPICKEYDCNCNQPHTPLCLSCSHFRMSDSPILYIFLNYRIVQFCLN